jgi:chromosome segregation ATPase
VATALRAKRMWGTLRNLAEQVQKETLSGIATANDFLEKLDQAIDENDNENEENNEENEENHEELNVEDHKIDGGKDKSVHLNDDQHQIEEKRYFDEFDQSMVDETNLQQKLLQSEEINELFKERIKSYEEIIRNDQIEIENLKATLQKSLSQKSDEYSEIIRQLENDLRKEREVTTSLRANVTEATTSQNKQREEFEIKLRLLENRLESERELSASVRESEESYTNMIGQLKDRVSELESRLESERELSASVRESEESYTNMIGQLKDRVSELESRLESERELSE